jgi:hypothetical protein
MKQTIAMARQDFFSSSTETQQFKAFYQQFKKDFTALLKPITNRIEIGKGHFYVSGFFELTNGQIWYFNWGDMRWSKDNMMLRRAKDFKDYTGGSNCFVHMFDERTIPNIMKLLGYATSN